MLLYLPICLIFALNYFARLSKMIVERVNQVIMREAMMRKVYQNKRVQRRLIRSI